MPFEVHALVEDGRNQHTILGLAIEDRMAGGFYLSIAGANMARVASEVGKLRQPLERFMQSQYVFFSVREPPLLQKGLGDFLNVGVSFTR